MNGVMLRECNSAGNRTGGVGFRCSSLAFAPRGGDRSLGPLSEDSNWSVLCT